MKIGFIGGGIMAEAMIGGILGQGIARPEEVCVGEPVEARRQQLTQRHGVATTADNREASQHGDLVVLSVKPQNLAEVLAELRPSLRREQVVLSIVAGARMESVVFGLGHEGVIRVMPNTPAQIGAGMSLWLATPAVSQAFRETTRSILRTLGAELEVAEEKYLDMATALSASGPAYVFLFLESLIDAGVYMGMSRDMARTLAVQTVLGSARLAQESGKHPAELRDMVTSPGGTTVEALKVLEDGRFRATAINAVVAAYEKSKRLGEQSTPGNRLEEMRAEIDQLKLMAGSLGHEVEALKTDVLQDKVIVLRTISREQAKKEVTELFQSGETVFYSDIARRLRLDLPLVVEICQELEEAGEIGVATDTV